MTFQAGRLLPLTGGSWGVRFEKTYKLAPLLHPSFVEKTPINFTYCLSDPYHSYNLLFYLRAQNCDSLVANVTKNPG